MTKKDKLIDMIAEGISSVDRKTVAEIFNIINEKDWKDFCSQMGDYDHPMERVNAKKEMDEKLEKLSGNSYTLQDAVAYVLRSLSMDIYPASKYYSKNFHTLDEEV